MEGCIILGKYRYEFKETLWIKWQNKDEISEISTIKVSLRRLDDCGHLIVFQYLLTKKILKVYRNITMYDM